MPPDAPSYALSLRFPSGNVRPVPIATTLGRGVSCGIRLDDRTVSEAHAHVFARRGVWFVTDLDSRNGTFVDGEVVPAFEDRPLVDGGYVRLGRTVALGVVLVPDPAQSPTTGARSGTLGTEGPLLERVEMRTLPTSTEVLFVSTLGRAQGLLPHRNDSVRAEALRRLLAPGGRPPSFSRLDTIDACELLYRGGPGSLSVRTLRRADREAVRTLSARINEWYARVRGNPAYIQILAPLPPKLVQFSTHTGLELAWSPRDIGEVIVDRGR